MTEQYLRSGSTFIMDESGIIMDNINPRIVSGAMYFNDDKWNFKPLDPSHKERFRSDLFYSN